MKINFLEEFKEIIKYRELLRNLVIRDLKVRYKRSMLGFAWVMLNPLLMMLIFYVVFSEIFKITVQNYTAYVISGVIFWFFFSQSTSVALRSFVGNSNLLKKVYIPKAVLPLSVIFSAIINLGLSLIPLFAIIIMTGTTISHNIFLLPVSILLIFIFSFGISLILSTLTVFFKDMIYIYEVLLLAWMYMTPVFYPESILPERYSLVFVINPLYHLMKVFRCSLYLNTSTLGEHLIYSSLFSLFILILGWIFYSCNKNRIVYHL